jgi:hypothetical protein
MSRGLLKTSQKGARNNDNQQDGQSRTDLIEPSAALLGAGDSNGDQPRLSHDKSRCDQSPGDRRRQISPRRRGKPKQPWVDGSHR